MAVRSAFVPAVSALALLATSMAGARAEDRFVYRAPRFDAYVDDGGMTLLTPPVAAFHLGSDGVARLAVNGASGSLHWTVAGVPPGLDFRNGELSGMASQVGPYDLHVRVEDDFRDVVERTWTIQVLDALSIRYPGDIAAPMGKPFSSDRPRLLGGAVAPIRYAVDGGSLPSGLRLDPVSGVVRGRATSVGRYSISVRATDSVGGVAVSAPFDVVVGGAREPDAVAARGTVLAIAFATSLKARVGVPLRGRRTEVTGFFTEPLTWSLVEPIPGVDVDGQGRLVGTPTEPGTYTSEVQLEDATGLRAYSASFDLDVMDALSAGPLPDRTIVVGRPVEIPPPAIDGSPQPPFAWSVGLLPDGLSIDPASGVVSGTPTQAGSYVVTVAASDAAGAGVSGSFQLDVKPPRVGVDARASNP